MIRPTRTLLLAAIVVFAACGGWATDGPTHGRESDDRGLGDAVVQPTPRYAAAQLPAGLDTLSGLDAVASDVASCTSDCAGLIYVWSPRMPLSRVGITDIAAASERLGTQLALVSTEELHRYAYGRADFDPGAALLADGLLRGGALAHAPALAVHERGEPSGHAILGYKTADTYEAMIRHRLAGNATAPEAGSSTSSSTLSAVGAVGRLEEDFDAIGNPGAYFRWIPGRGALAYESGERIYLLDLADGRSRVAPGFVDFVPTPDGRFFVTPGPRWAGLEFYDADEVFDAVSRNRSAEVQPFFTDRQMRDQYPSIGIVERDGPTTVYRVLTSWFDAIVYRDYAVRTSPSGALTVRPLGEPVTPCAGVSASIPIISQDGLEVAARDEATGTTKIFEILRRGRCDEILDLGVGTSKVAWHRTGQYLAFAIPRIRRRGVAGGGEHGLFVYDRNERRLTRVRDSEAVSLLAFPDFVGDDSVVFLIPGSSNDGQAVFRVVDTFR